MTRMTTTPLAVSADYRDALVAARRAKNWLFLVLLLFLLAQITIFFLVKYDVIKIGAGGTATVKAPTDIDIDAKADVETPATGESPATAPTTGPADAAVPADAGASPGTTTPADTATPGGITTPADAGPGAAGGGTPPSLMAVAQAGTADANVSASVETTNVTTTVLPWVVNSIVYLGTIFSILMAVVILLIVLIMLVGRFEGMSPSTSAFVWMALLALLLFPWQLCYGPETSGAAAMSGGAASSAASYDAESNDFRVPGVLYTWGELRRDAKFPNDPIANAVQKWARFAGFPVLALLILFTVQARSGRAVKVALGEADVHVDVATTDV